MKEEKSVQLMELEMDIRDIWGDWECFHEWYTT